MRVRPNFFVGLTAAALALGSGCREAEPDQRHMDTPEELVAITAAWDRSTLGRATAAMADAHPGESGFLLLDRGRDALSWRLIAADTAEVTIDAQYFLWKDDAAGKVMMQRLTAAAERGVRVRVLIDDSMTDSDPQYLARFDAHPMVEVRLYKPFGPRHKSDVMRWVDYVVDLKTMNRRMHNKLMLVDGSIAFIGGRNIADEYFEYPVPFVFKSRDLLAVGPVARTGAEAFELYWESDWTRSVTDAVKPVPSAEDGVAQQRALDAFAREAASYPPGFYDDPGDLDEELKRLASSLIWGKAKLLVDAMPEKDGTPQSHDKLDLVGTTLRRVASESREEVHIQSAYLILLDGGFDALAEMRKRGVTVIMSTNSMASNNHLTAFEGYKKQRHRLLESGGWLYEMRTNAAEERALFTPTQLAANQMEFGLHAKTMVFDRKIAFVGSFNLDPRSVNLNTEMGLLIESAELAEQIAKSIETDVQGENSWQVRLTGEGRLEWITSRDGALTSQTETEPQSSSLRRAEAWLLQVIPDDSQL